MSQSAAVWVLILLALCTASLPFVLQRPLLALPWAQAGEPQRPGWLRVAVWLLQWLLLAAWCMGVYHVLGRTLIGMDALFSVAVVLALVVAVALLAYPGWSDRGHAVRKSFVARLLEVLALYALIGALARAFEAQIGNVYPQGWEFYAITLCLYVVMAYPGFVYRYLLRRN